MKTKPKIKPVVGWAILNKDLEIISISLTKNFTIKEKFKRKDLTLIPIKITPLVP